MAIINQPGMRTRAISRKGRAMMSAMFLLLAFVLGMAGGQLMFHFAEPAISRSESVGRLLCGDGMRVARMWTGEESSRIACFDQGGQEVLDRGGALGLLFGLPFFLLFSAPMQWFVWRARLRGRVL